MRQISKRLETLERAADKEIFANAFPYAIAYYLGDARHESEVLDAYTRALGYNNFDEFLQPLADLLQEPSDSLANRRTCERIRRAVRKLLAKFGYDLRDTRPAVWADAAYQIVRTLPEEWLATIRSGYREMCEAEARADQLLKEAMKLAEEC
ncbi:MAG: hypothetical protein WCD75_12125 [Rhodoplanes sp.]